MLFEGKAVLVKDPLDAFDGDPKKWVDTSICKVTAADVVSVAFTKGKESVKLARKDGAWTLEGLGPKEEIDTSKTYSLDSALSYLNLTGIADPKLTEAELGFATGAVYTATLKNGITYTAKVGNAVGSDRTLKLSAAFAPVGTNAHASKLHAPRGPENEIFVRFRTAGTSGMRRSASIGANARSAGRSTGLTP